MIYKGLIDFLYNYLFISICYPNTTSPLPYQQHSCPKPKLANAPSDSTTRLNRPTLPAPMPTQKFNLLPLTQLRFSHAPQQALDRELQPPLAPLRLRPTTKLSLLLSLPNMKLSQMSLPTTTTQEPSSLGVSLELSVTTSWITE